MGRPKGKRAPRTTPLSEQQRKFVEYYMGEAKGVGVVAAELAGYRGNRKALTTRAMRLLRSPHIRAAIDARAAASPEVATREDRQRFWSAVMRGDPMPQMTPEGITVERPASVRDRLLAAKLLGQTQGDFVERRENTVRTTMLVAHITGGAPDVSSLLDRAVAESVNGPVLLLPDNGRRTEEVIDAEIVEPEQKP